VRVLLSLLLVLLPLAGCAGDAEGLLVERPERGPGVFQRPAECIECHPQHVEQWAASNHAYAAVDPVFHAMVRLGQRQSEGKLGQFCVQCHTPVGLAEGQTEVVFDEAQGIWQQPMDDLQGAASDGVSCDVCHSITDVHEPRNARMTLTADGTKRATIADPMPTQAHGSAYSELHASGEVCGTCHNVTNPKDALVEQTFDEWAGSSFAEDGTTCMDCHMPPRLGRAAPDAPIRELHDHTMVGVDVSLLPPDEFPGYELLRDRSAELLRSAADLDVAAEGGEIVVTVTNRAGHALPSGATAERQLWLEVVVWDDVGQLLFESGTLDARGDLRDGLDGHSLEPGTDPQLVQWGQLLVSVPDLDGLDGDARDARLLQADAACLPFGRGGVVDGSGITPVSFPWQANWQCDHLIAADGDATARFDVGSAGHARVRLLFRSFPPYFLRELEHDAGLDPDVATRVPTVEIASRWVELSGAW